MRTQAERKLDERRRKIRRGGKGKHSYKIALMQGERDRKARQLRESRLCALDSRCPYGGPGKCCRIAHRRREYELYEPEVEYLKDGQWESVSVNPGSRYSPRLTWKALRESGALENRAAV